MSLVASNVYKIWLATQSAKGTPATTASKSLRMVAGNVVTNNELGAENFSDGSKWGDQTDWFNTILGQGTPGYEAGSDELAWLLWAMHSTETVAVTGTNNLQTGTMTGTPTGGTVTLVYDGRTTATVAYNAAAAAVQTALEALPNIGTGNVTVGGGPWPGTAITVTFTGALQKRPHPTITLGTNALTGGTTPSLSFAQTTPGVNATHKTVPNNNLGFWMTLWQTVGLTGDIQRQKYNDGRIGGLTIEASTANKAVRVTPNFIFVDPGEVYATDPVLTAPPSSLASPVMIYTEGAGTFEVDDVAIRGQSQFQIALNENITPVYGDDVVPHDIGRGNATATVTITIAADTDALRIFNTAMYGTASPSPGTKPLKRLPAVGSYSFNMLKKDSASNTIGSLLVDIPGVRWQIPDSVAPNPDTGTADLSLAGGLRKLGSADMYSFTVGNQQAAYTV